MVFDLVTSLEDDLSTQSMRLHPLFLSQTCSLWLRITLSTPSLWSIIDYRAPLPLNRLFLERSQNSSLSVVAETKGLYNDPFHALVGEAVSRIREIRSLDRRSYLQDRVHLFNPALRKIISGAASLEVFEVKFPWETFYHFSAGDLPAVDPFKLPKLRRLHLEYFVTLPVGHSTPTALTHLTLTCNVRDDGAFVAKVLNFLALSPALRVLKITSKDGDPDRPPLDVRHRAIVQLSCLELCSITAGVPATFHSLLDRLDFPVNTAVRLVDSSYTFDLPRGICSFLPLPGQGVTLPAILESTTALCIGQTQDGMNRGQMVLTSGDGNTLYSVRMAVYRKMLLARSLHILPLTIDTTHVRELWLRPILSLANVFTFIPAGTRAAIAMWRAFFVALPTLELLGLPFDYTCIVCSLCPLPNTDSGEQMRLLCPRLSTVHIWLSTLDDIVDQLLQIRSTCGLVIQSLHFHAHPSRSSEWIEMSDRMQAGDGPADVSVFHPRPSVWASSSEQKDELVSEKSANHGRYPYVADVTVDSLDEEILDKVGTIASIRARMSLCKEDED